ncbi:Uncharacterised protein [Mycolicibacterium fortuitum]|uniref:Uncharacterized protein n=1 Tax=Mycolicibacterium fortuitum TaxID=1766 RepID=A0A378U9Y9_MYCFO|nr:hypothetical protein CPGR_01271 [Mycolicibacterium fortuitum subsp. fortuitum DSM 46621 = ATCC 6841 = JCM 6387]CRL82119.1 hypothetical protein CPGR_05336 [Mycolicibacter nonchromogenicus]STZ74208.1 Uncharacterised protein [Mycolicibacterium fortuitum]
MAFPRFALSLASSRRRQAMSLSTVTSRTMGLLHG